MASRNFSLVTGALMGWFAVGSYLRGRRPESRALQSGTAVSSGGDVDQRARDGAREIQTEAKSSWIMVDGDGKQLDGNAHYRIVGDLNMPGSWWSITLYDCDGSLRSNTEERYAFTSFNVIPEDNGLVIIDVAAERPGAVLNWLPCRKGEPFCLAMRFYRSGTHMLDHVDPSDLPRILKVS